MRKAAVIIQIVIVSFIIVYGTVNLFLGRFEDAFITFPFLLFYYIYVVARQKRRQSREKDNEDSL